PNKSPAQPHVGPLHGARHTQGAHRAGRGCRRATMSVRQHEEAALDRLKMAQSDAAELTLNLTATLDHANQTGLGEITISLLGDALDPAVFRKPLDLKTILLLARQVELAVDQWADKAKAAVAQLDGEAA